MALVDYSSTSGESGDEEPPAKRRRYGSDTGSEAGVDPTPGKDAVSDLPPLPSTFHDLYASTVRQSVVDDPSLHQGRKRLVPHVPGNWPSHVYVEWHPTNTQHDVLTQLLSDVERELGGLIPLHGFLTSDLGAPLPLHISLSRPLSLPTADKDAFLDRLTSSLQSSSTGRFSVTPHDLAWYRSPDSERTFLILRVAAGSSNNEDNEGDAAAPPPWSPQLLDLLTRCNAAATQFRQPPLYQQTRDEPVGAAFHVSVAWSFGRPGEEASLRALRVLRQRRRYAEVRAWEIDVPAVKVKIGNVVHHVPLSGPGRKGSVDGGLFGV